MTSFFYASLERIPIGVAISIEFTGPLTLAIFLSRRWTDLVAALVAGSGTSLLAVGALTAKTDPIDRVGVLYAFIAGIFWATYVLVASKSAKRFQGLDGLAVASLIAGVLILPFGISTAHSSLLEPKPVAIGLGVALLASVVPYACETTALRTLSRQTFSVLIAMEPAIGVLAGLVVLQQTLSLVQLLAVALITTGATIAASSRPVAPGCAPPRLPCASRAATARRRGRQARDRPALPPDQGAERAFCGDRDPDLLSRGARAVPVDGAVATRPGPIDGQHNPI